MCVCGGGGGQVGNEAVAAAAAGGLVAEAEYDSSWMMSAAGRHFLAR